MSNFENQISNKIKLISQCFVKPKYEVEASKQPYYLGVVDLGFLSLDQIQKGLLFSTKPKNIQSDLLDTLKESLAVCLVYFYPLAGRFETKEFPDENSKWIYLDCTKGPGARLIHASVEYTVSDILSSVDVHPIVRSFFDLGEKAINYDGHTRALLSIQVTELTDGVFIGFSMNHSVVDGNSQWNFINSLSEIFLQLIKTKTNQNNNIIIPTISQKPVFKPYFPDGWGPILKIPNDVINKSIPESKNNNKIILRERIFHFSSKSIGKLKAKANNECNMHNTISSFQALSAFIWRSITRARNLKPELETCCALAMNARPRFNPPLSNEYFGNFIIRQQSMCKVGELMTNNLGWAAMLVHKVVISQDDKKVREFYEWMVKFLCEGQMDMDMGMDNPFYSPNLVMIGGSARFDVYGPDFGLGKAEIGLAGYCNKEDGKVTASPGREGGGSVDLEVCLRPEYMKALELDEEFMSFVNNME